MAEERLNNLKTVLVWLLKLLGIALAVWLVRRTLANADADLGSALATPKPWEIKLQVSYSRWCEVIREPSFSIFVSGSLG